MKKLLFIMCAAAAFTGCGNNGGDGEGSNSVITGYDNAKLNQSIASDQTSANFSFTASEAWSTDVKGVNSTTFESLSEDDVWVTLSPDSGDAGKVDMTITIQPNTSNKSRTANIGIVCGGETVLTVKIEQRGVGVAPDPTPDPNMRYVKKLLREGTGFSDTNVFEYDEKMRVSKILTTYSEGDKTYDYVIAFTYDGNKVIAKRSEDGEDYSMEMQLDDKGRMVTATTEGIHSDPVSDTGRSGFSSPSLSFNRDPHKVVEVFTFSYDSNGYLSRVDKKSTCENGVENEPSIYCTWKNGTMSEIKRSDDRSVETVAIETSKFVNNAACNIDFFSSAMSASSLGGEIFDIPGVLGFQGTRSKYLPATIVEDIRFTESNSKYTYLYEYTLDSKGFVSKYVETHEDGFKVNYTVEYYD